jgi:uncharacterized DUF497 family protein
VTEADSITVHDLIWNKRNREHITKHAITARQVEQVFHDKRIGLQSHSGRLLVLGRCGKRLVTVVLSPKGKKFYVVTARDMRKKEGEYYQSFLNTL